MEVAVLSGNLKRKGREGVAIPFLCLKEDGGGHFPFLPIDNKENGGGTMSPMSPVIPMKPPRAL